MGVGWSLTKFRLLLSKKIRRATTRITIGAPVQGYLRMIPGVQLSPSYESLTGAVPDDRDETNLYQHHRSLLGVLQTKNLLFSGSAGLRQNLLLEVSVRSFLEPHVFTHSEHKGSRV